MYQFAESRARREGETECIKSIGVETLEGEKGLSSGGRTSAANPKLNSTIAI